jgi:protein SCO1/2
LSTVLVSGAICLVGTRPRPAVTRAGQDLGQHPFPLGTFALSERSGRTVNESDLADSVWIASFIFTRCPLSCPRITSTVKGLQGRLARSPVQLVSVSVDPDYDTPEVLAAYARKFDADIDRWWFLTGPMRSVEELVVNRFKLGLAKAGTDDGPASPEAISHSDRLVLVDRGNRIVGYFDSTDRASLDALVQRAIALAGTARSVPAWVRGLPAVNATLNGSATVLLVLGWTLIRLGRVRGHVVCMAAGIILSSLFLGCYLLYHAKIGGGVPFRGEGPIRFAYFTILLSHVVLAAAIVPLIAVTLTRALRRQFDRHVRIAKVTLPIWLYVSVTGVIIYVMLYQLPFGSRL